jgi:hypothetical protein
LYGAGAVASASAAQTAASASAAVGTAVAQAAIDAMESQVSLTNTGMDLLTVGQSPNFTLATFGTTTKFFDGVASGSANKKLVLNASGINLYGADTTDRLDIASGAVSMYTNNVRGVHIIDNKISLGPIANASATLGAVIGNIHLASTGAYIYGAAATTFAALTSAGLEFTETGTKKAIFGTTTAIGGATAVTTTSTDEVVRIDSLGVKIYNDSSNYTFVSASGMSVFSGGNNVASFGTTMRVGRDETDKSALRVAADGSMSIGVKDGTPKFSVAATLRADLSVSSLPTLIVVPNDATLFPPENTDIPLALTNV